MKRILMLLLVPLVTLAFAGASFAQGTPEAPAKPTSPAKTSEKRESAAKAIRATGQLAATDPKTHTIKVKTKDAELTLFVGTEELRGSLGRIKVGSTVNISYVEKDGKLTLRSVARTSAKTESKGTTTEKQAETKPAK